MSKALLEKQEKLKLLVRSLELQSVYQRGFSLQINEEHNGKSSETISLMRWIPAPHKIEYSLEGEDTSSLVSFSLETTLIIASEDAVTETDSENEASLDEDKIIATLESNFSLSFHSDQKISLDPKEADIISRTRCLFEMWPYWREFVAQACFRSNLPPINFPPFTAEVASQGRD